jgi:bifunctional N-acetylglucosamine-1-phosphate-uridyltransferase/glucosamine-1-phosphate-acetyltransferase GlmU-like protein
MAGGLGKRMNSELPKVLHLINGKPMLYWVIKQAKEVSKKIIVVVGKYKKQIKKAIEFNDLIYVDQPEEITGYLIKTERVKGTGDAIHCCLPYLNDEPTTNVLILSGDVPLITVKTLNKLLETPNTILIKKTNNPTGYGRIVADGYQVKEIVEEKDCSPEQKEIRYVNGGIYNLTIDTLMQTIPYIKNENEAKEYYLTDFVFIANEKKINIYSYELPETQSYELININTPDELIQANNSEFHLND